MIVTDTGPASTTCDFFWEDASGNIWDTTANTGAGGFVSIVDGNVANYRTAATETPSASGRFVSAAAPTGSLKYTLRIRASLFSTSYAVAGDLIDFTAVEKTSLNNATPTAPKNPRIE